MADQTTYKVILSINGKQTPIAEWTDYRSSDVTLELVRYAYKQVVSWMSDPKAQEQKTKTNSPYCPDHQIPLVFRKGKYGNFYSCTYKLEDGSYCKHTAKAS